MQLAAGRRCNPTELTDLVRTGVVIRATPDDKEFAHTAGDSRGAHGFLQGSHLGPAVGEGVVALHAAQAVLPIVPSHHVHLHTGGKTAISSCSQHLLHSNVKLNSFQDHSLGLTRDTFIEFLIYTQEEKNMV